MNLLVTNDDGIQAQGLKHLATALVKNNNVLLAAPDTERSGSGHSTSLVTPIKYKKIKLIDGAECYQLSGTPTDCVKFGISFLAKDNIDLVVSGINHGKNLGTDVIYSGTVAAGMEALIGGYSAITVSHSGFKDYNFEYAADFIVKNLSTLYKFSNKECVINVNFPSCAVSEIKGVKITPLGREKYNDKYKVYGQSEDEGYILDKLPHIKADNPDNCDIVLNSEKYITITPLHLDLTDYKTLSKLSAGDIIL